MCVLGKRLLKDININNCSKAIPGPLHDLYCTGDKPADCDPYYAG